MEIDTELQEELLALLCVYNSSEAKDVISYEQVHEGDIGYSTGARKSKLSTLFEKTWQ